MAVASENPPIEATTRRAGRKSASGDSSCSGACDPPPADSSPAAKNVQPKEISCFQIDGKLKKLIPHCGDQDRFATTLFADKSHFLKV
jgi:hypothetical protein